jgi:hypothetical protein
MLSMSVSSSRRHRFEVMKLLLCCLWMEWNYDGFDACSRCTVSQHGTASSSKLVPMPVCMSLGKNERKQFFFIRCQLLKIKAVNLSACT